MYRGRLQRDLAIWTEKGLLAPENASAILAEYDGREQTFTVGRVLMMLAAVLLAGAVLMVVASNWDGMSHALRSSFLIMLIWLFNGLAAYTRSRGNGYLPGAFLVLGMASFGASIALIGQMYNLSGDLLSSAALWFIVCVATAILFRSAALTYFAGILGWFFLSTMATETSTGAGSLWFYAPLLQALAVLALVYYTGAERARHTAYLLVLAWLAWIYAERHDDVAAWAYAVAGIGLFLLAALPVSPLHRMARGAGAAPAFYSFVLALMGLLLFQIENGDIFGSASGTVALAMPAILAAGFSVLGVALEGRDNGAVRYLGYVVFAGEILYLSLVTAGTMLGTSGIFLLSGLILALVAWLVIKLEKRMGGVYAAKGA